MNSVQQNHNHWNVIIESTAHVESSEVTEYKHFVTYRLSQINAKLSRQATRILQEHSGLSVVQWRILALLSATAPTTSSALVKSIAMDAGLFSRNLKSLIADGLVLTRTDRNDHRQQLLSLSKAGAKHFNHAAPFMQQRREQLTHNISANELAIFHSVLDKLETNAAQTSL